MVRVSSDRCRMARHAAFGVSVAGWPSVGWCVGLIKEANGDRRFKMEGEVINFFVHYEIDDNTSRHVLKLDKYGCDDVDAWVLLEALA